MFLFHTEYHADGVLDELASIFLDRHHGGVALDEVEDVGFVLWLTVLKDGTEDEDSVLVVAQYLVVVEDLTGYALDQVDVAELEHSLNNAAAILVKAVADDF